MNVLTIGTFDLLHTGHRHLFARAATYGELTVGVNSDRFVTFYKGRRPVEPEDTRMEKVFDIPQVASVVLNDGCGSDLIEAHKPDLLVVGSDWVDRDYLNQIDVSRERIEQIGCDLLYVSRLPGFSTSALRSVSFSAVVVTHANERGARRMLEQLITQTRPPDEIILVATAIPASRLSQIAADYPQVKVDAISEVGDWGHAKRAYGLALASCEWVGFFNDDDAYAPDYLEKMLVAAGDLDVVYCEWNENPGCGFRLYQSTAGNFIVRRDLATKIGWSGRHYEADGEFIEALNQAGARIAKVDELLYWHNAYEVAV